ncbi:DUF1697 domain-containing protein [Marinicrinis sediminis]|uniref:DUF1697 domain-containing protein n=1 Tax=Marinicrinis sediminis TaxID=1652465 RepID=A0ABW5R9Y3_9BACL
MSSNGYIALLRGINVGGHHKIKMAELRELLEEIGLEQIQTYIQSGNVLFTSSQPEQELRDQLEQAIKERFGFAVPVILRTRDEWEQLISNNPFTDGERQAASETSEGESFYVAMLHEPPSPEVIEKWKSYQTSEERMEVVGRDVYLLFPNSIRNSKMANQIHSLGLATTRNGKTILKLQSMAHRLSSL